MLSRYRTKRKVIVRKSLRATVTGFALLEELRWYTLRQESNAVRMTKSYASSFARTIRESVSELVRHKIEIPYVRAGLLARAALYRVDDWRIIETFLNSDQASATCMLSAHDKEYDYWPPNLMYIPRPSRFRLSMAVDLEINGRRVFERILFPIPTPLTVVGKSQLMDGQVEMLATVKWRTFLLSGREFGWSSVREIDPTQPIDTATQTV